MTTARLPGDTRTGARLLLLGVLSTATIAGCSSDDDGGVADDGAAVAPVPSPDDGPGPLGSPTAVFSIEPEDVDAYVAEYEEQASRVVLELDGRSQTAPTPLDFDAENARLLLGLSAGALGVFLDPDTGEPLPTLTYFEGDFAGVTSEEQFLAAVTRTLVGEDLDLQGTPEGDSVHTGRLVDADTGEETDVRFVSNESILTGGATSLEIDGTDAVLSGALGTRTYVQLRDMITMSPEVDRLVMTQVPGSYNDGINLHNGYLVREAGLDTFIPADGDVSSGGTDLFLAGTARTIEDGALYGVHSWCCEDGVEGADLPRDDPAHDEFLTYMRTMLGDAGPDFYYFTLDAAPFDGMYDMTREDLVEYGIVTP